jgi:branched-chain amino acid transport system substrate-binding protein
MGGTVTVLWLHMKTTKQITQLMLQLLSAGGSATLAVLGYADTGGRGIIAASEDTGAFSVITFLVMV